MLGFNCVTYQEHLANSISIADCNKVPVPECAEHQNYIFISYSHKDYKKVYHDLASMHEAGVRFWYDEELTAGYDWDDEVYKKITDPHCSGVIFYLSENFFNSESIYKEVPSALIEDSLVESPDCEQFFENTEETLRDFLLNAFRDKATYIQFESKGYIEKLLVQIRRNFNVIDLTGDDASLIGEYNGEMLNGKRCGYGVCKYDITRSKFCSWMFKLNEDIPKYTGDMNNGVYHGKGCLTDSNGKYDGDWVNGKRSGKGIQIFKDGTIYNGDWENNCFSGIGCLTEANKLVFNGIFKNDNFISGTISLPNGKTCNVIDGSVVDRDIFNEIPKENKKLLNLK